MADRRKPADRRTASDRRRRDRRRKNDSRVFVLELTADEVRIAQLDRAADAEGLDQVSAATVTWRKNSVALESPEGLAELTAALREVARRYSMFTADVRVVLDGQFCVTRTVRGPIEHVRAELQRLEQRSRLYLALGPGEKVLVTHTRMLDARHAHALAAACNKATLEAVQTAAEDAGLEVTVIEPALAALARAASRMPDVPNEPFLLLNVTDSAMEIAIIHQGQLLLDYRPGGATGAAELPTLLLDHTNRLNRHVARYLRTSTTLKHAYLCSAPATLDEAVRQFSRRSPLTVRPIRPGDVKATWQLGKGAEHATPTLLGGLLLTYLPAEESDAPNFMQHILEGRREPLRPKLTRSLAPLAAAALLAFGFSWFDERQRNELTEMRAELDGLAVSAARATELRLQLLASSARLEQLRKLAGTLPADVGAPVIRQLGACMPGDVWLTHLAVTDRDSIRLQGASYLEAGVYDFVRWLELAPGFTEVALKRTGATSSASGPATSFELELTLGEFNDQATRVARHE